MIFIMLLSRCLIKSLIKSTEKKVKTSSKFTIFLKGLFNGLLSFYSIPKNKKELYKLVEKYLIKVVLLQLKVSASFPVFLASALMKKGFHKHLIPFFNKLIRVGMLEIDLEKGEIIEKKVTEAEENQDVQAYKDAANSIWS